MYMIKDNTYLGILKSSVLNSQCFFRACEPVQNMIREIVSLNKIIAIMDVPRIYRISYKRYIHFDIGLFCILYINGYAIVMERKHVITI